MLIRSQNKKYLANMNNISIFMMDEDAICFDVSAIINSGRVVTLGEYETMEKVAKVMDMIQNAYTNAVIHSLADTFQMPQDEEVE